MTLFIIQQLCSWSTLPGSWPVSDSSPARKMLTFWSYLPSNRIASQIVCKSPQTCYAMLPFLPSFFSSHHLRDSSSLLSPVSAPLPCPRSTLPFTPAANLTFTPGVEEHDDVLAGVVSGRRLGRRGGARRREPVQTAHCIGWGVDGQLDLVAALLYDLGLPAFILQVIYQRNDGMGAFGHRGQGTYTTQVIFESECSSKDETKRKTLRESFHEQKPDGLQCIWTLATIFSCPIMLRLKLTACSWPVPNH